ncbi:MAG: TRAP transporter small permease [Sulfuriferula multivorans]|uniref:TRAP transporter small permease protein n=1 Tax=Sulfuriferula multivorans TaxID=1559896 RepID=A0A7C9P9B1_9PROT|nr:TRAP transporter small permease [Sulfuriferula multivorans]
MKSLVKLLHGLMASLNVIGAIWVLLIMLLITVDVVGRAFFNSPLFGVPEIVKISVVGLVWCQMAHTLKIGAHLRSTILLDRMPRAARRVIEIVSCILGVITFALIVYSGWDTMLEAWRIGEFEGEEPVRVPTSPIRTLVLIGAALTAIQFLVMLVDLIRGKTLHQAEAEF